MSWIDETREVVWSLAAPDGAVPRPPVGASVVLTPSFRSTVRDGRTVLPEPVKASIDDEGLSVRLLTSEAWVWRVRVRSRDTGTLGFTVAVPPSDVPLDLATAPRIPDGAVEPGPDWRADLLGRVGSAGVDADRAEAAASSAAGAAAAAVEAAAGVESVAAEVAQAVDAADRASTSATEAASSATAATESATAAAGAVDAAGRAEAAAGRAETAETAASESAQAASDASQSASSARSEAQQAVSDAEGHSMEAQGAAARAETAAGEAASSASSATSAAARAELIDARTVASAALDAGGHLILTRSDGSTVDAGLARGSNGLDAYALAVQQGYVGTLTQWLASLKGKDGAPGASSIAPDSRLIFGTGSPQGVHAAGVGVRFSCIDEGGWYGAKEWRKDTATGTTGWRVVDGDTGWRAFTPPQATLDNLHTGFASRFLVRRIAGRVEVQFALRLVAAAGWPTIWRVPLGYRGRGEFSTTLRVVMPGLASGMQNVSGAFEYNTHPPEHSINFSGGAATGHDLITRGLTAGGSWACDDAWSAALFTSTSAP